jgi:TP901 family phage tail tape measure protein
VTLSAGTVSLGVTPNTAGLGAKLAAGIMGESGVLGKVGNELGLNLTKGIGVALVATAALAVKMAADMQGADAKIQGNAQITAKAATAIGDAFLSTAGKSTFSGSEMAKAFAPVAGVIQMISGHTLTAADSMKVMAASTTLAEASGQPLANTTADLAAVMQSFGLKVAAAADTSNTLFNTSRLTNVGLDTLANTVDKLHGRLGIAAPSLADTSGLMVDLATHGISGSRGVMVVQGALTTLLAGSKATSGELKLLGANVYDSSGKFVGMQSVLGQITPKLAAMTQQQRGAAEAALFGKSGAAALNSTILAGAKGLGEATAKVIAHHAAEKAAAAASSTFEGKLKTLKAGFTDILTTLGEKLMPLFMGLETWVSKNIPLILTIVAAITAWQVALLAMKAAQVVSSIAIGIASVAQWAWNAAMDANPIGIIIVAVGALVAAIIWVATKTTFFQTIWKDMTTGIKVAWEWVYKNAIQPIGQLIGLEIKAVGIIVNWLWTNVFKPVGDFIVRGVNAVGSAVGSVFGAIGGIIKGAFNGVVDFTKSIFNTIAGLVNGVIDGINSATSAGAVIGIHIGKIPHLPHLAAGATVLPTPGGTIVRVAEGGKAETVVDTGKVNGLIDAALKGSDSNQPIMMDGQLFGWLVKIAGQQAQIVLNKAFNAMAVQQNAGGLA